MRVLAKSYLVPSFIEGNILKPLRRRLNKLRANVLKSGQVRARNRLVELNKTDFMHIKDNLRTYGFSKISDDVLPQDDLASFCLRVNDSIATEGLKGEENKNFWQRPLSGIRLDSDHFLVKFAMHEHILNIASEYIGGMPLLNSVEVIRSVDSGNEEFTKSQMWHNDHDDSRMLKLFVYLSDVNNHSDGPFEYFDSHHTRGMRLRYSPVHKTDAVVDSASVTEHLSVFGEVGTCFFVDTSRCLHRGSRVRGEASRLAYIATYTSGCRLVSRKAVIEVSDNADQFTALLIKPIDC